MSNVYQSWASEGCKIHYVSNSPWQVYPAIDEFLQDNHFPKGSIHLRPVSTQGLLLGRPGQHKYESIVAIIKDFPQRKFVLIGDSGEFDPELYARIYHEYPDQIAKIFIHDVTSERAMHADRQGASRSDLIYQGVKRLMSSSSNLRRSNTSSEAMDVFVHRDIPKEQQMALDPRIPVKTKLEQFEHRMTNVSLGMRHGVFSVFTLASQLLLVIADDS
ncbi:hypothetical protein DM01DRAFT_1293395 [Hesseltinella vesiculosa]|uniref:Phosphatidate phosphatase APP1 catalytic domain-containing protein n=1 Tax=Hesseltinella vesiculosa TaxID=101127 RepID=A0A1X2G774_9FUNG|nr:hypothetical protein DM01DRAFT_1293395 [Hesseltinella vesiculosa]